MRETLAVTEVEAGAMTGVTSGLAELPLALRSLRQRSCPTSPRQILSGSGTSKDVTGFARVGVWGLRPPTRPPACGFAAEEP